MRLRAGLIRTSPLWGSILDQEGFPWEAIRSPDQVDVDSYSIIIAGKISGNPWDEVVKRYVRAGGAAVIDQDLLAGWSEGKKRWGRYRYLVSNDNGPLLGNRLIDIQGRGLVLEEGGALRTDRDDHVLPIHPFGSGLLTGFPFDLPRCIRDIRSARKLFPSPVRPLPSEKVSRVPKGELRRIVRGVLKALHHLRGLHYAHVWYFPGEATNLFGLRIDTDYSHRDEVRDLYSVLESEKVPASWFLHVKAHVGWLRDFSEMAGQEIGVHCYAHREYGSPGLRGPDIAKAADLLRAAGLDPGGFSAPFGIWKEDLQIDLERVGFHYSSEFGFDYDNLPSFPWVRGGFSRVLQLPVHPISIGSLARVGYRDGEMIDYYAAVVDRKLSENEPIFIYVHPGDAHVDVLKNLFDRIDEERVRKTTLGEFIDRWRHRREVLGSLEMSLDENAIVCRSEGDNRDDRFRISITDPAGKRSLARPEGRIEWHDLEWRSEPEPLTGAVDASELLGGRHRRLIEDIRTYFWRRRG